MTDTKEALAALDELPASPDDDHEMGLRRAIRQALQSVAQEREDWRAVEGWLAKDTDRDFILSPSVTQPGQWVGRAINGDGAPSYFGPASRNEVVSAAATWARAEMGKP